MHYEPEQIGMAAEEEQKPQSFLRSAVKRFVMWTVGRITHRQCCETLKEGHTLYYCVEHYGHLGKHVTNNGKEF